MSSSAMDRMPILVGVGQITEKTPGLEGLSSPVDLMVQATEAALADAHLSKTVLGQVDTLVVVRSFRESTPNSPEALAKRPGASHAAQWLMPNGGNGPQYLVNRYAQAIAEGRCELALFSGAEAIDNGRKLLKAGLVTSEKRGKEVFYSTSDTGAALCESYRDVREQCLLEGLSRMDISGDDLREIGSSLRALSGQYDQASRAASSL